MIQRLRELACVILDHDWWYSDSEAMLPRWRGKVGVYRFCERCHKLDVNL